MPSNNNDDRIEVTDHALVRYLERVKNINVEKLKRQIGTRQVTVLARAMGEGDYPVNNEFYARVVNGKVVTVLPSK